MDKLKKYGFKINEQTSKAVKQVEKILSSYWRDMDKMEKTYRIRLTTAVNGMTTADEMNDIVNQLEFTHNISQIVMDIMWDKAQELGVEDDYEGEI